MNLVCRREMLTAFFKPSHEPPHLSLRDYMSRVRRLAAFQAKLDTEEWPVQNKICTVEKFGDYGGICALWIEVRKPSGNPKTAFDTSTEWTRIQTIEGKGELG